MFIDECSTLSNSDMNKILKKISFNLLILVGDVFQIESIRFGNWFSLVKSFIPKTSVFELTKPYRSKERNLLDLWEKVRKMDDRILENVTKNNYSTTLNNSIFQHSEEDEIILCLNYDGLYGINNINRFLQKNNNKNSNKWGIHTYKINDPVLFNESNRFAPLIYNNLKGKILDIEIFDDKIRFNVEIDISINEFDIFMHDDLKLLDGSNDCKSVIEFFVNKSRNTDEDDSSSAKNVVPFQVAYAVSIHKAQGLEYKSVKIVFVDEIEEMITHNIFYTAITRAREDLKIYWTPETENRILNRFIKKCNTKDINFLKAKFFKTKNK